MWLRFSSFRGLTEADMWRHLAEGLLPAYDQPQPGEAAVDQSAETTADTLARAGVRAWAEYEADTEVDDAVICPPTRTLLALLEQVREVWKARLANLELPTVEQLAEAIAATISQRINTPPELQHAQWLTGTMTAVGVEMQQHHTEPTLLRVGDDNLCATSLGKEDEEFADTLRMAVALTSPVALLRAVRLRTILIYITESDFDPSELLVHPFSHTVREAGDLGGKTGHNHLRRTTMGLLKKARKTPPASIALRAEQRPVYTLSLQLTAHHHSIIGATRGTDRTEQWRKTVSTACGKIKTAPTKAELWPQLALGLPPAYDKGPDRLDDYDHGSSLAPPPEGAGKYEAEETYTTRIYVARKTTRASTRRLDDMAEAFGTDQESLQALLANIMASSPKEDGSGKALVADTPETSPGSAYLSSCTADFAPISALPTANGPQSMSTGQIPELVKDNSFDALLRSLQAQTQPQNQAPHSDFVDGDFGGLLQHHDTDDGSDRLGFQKASPGLGNIVNHLLSSRSKRSLPETEDPHNDDIRGFLTIPGCDDDPEFGQDLQPATDNGGNSIIGLKRAITDQGQYHGHSKAKKTSERGDEDSARKQQMQKLQDQSQTLKTANVMLSKYLEGLQGNLSEILAENWSFKILIGCLTSKQQSTNPLEQMISAKIASNPSVAIPMLKSIHLSAAASSSSQEADSAASSKDSVFQSMVGLLAAQRQGG
eukprot:jgi/Tetstr1/423623/TSEL_001395.t1